MKNVVLRRGGSKIFLGGGALVSFSTSTLINHIVFFFLQNTRGGVHPLHPPPRSAPGKLLQDVIVVSCTNLINLWNVF